MNPRHILGLLIMGVLALAVSGLVGSSEAASSRRLPACPQTWPETTGWHGNWYVIIDRDSNGNKHGRAYPADAKYRQGYVPAAPHEACIVRIRDNPGVTQLTFREDRDRTRQISVAGTGASDNQGVAEPETPTPESTDPTTYSVSPAAVVIEGRSAALTITLSEAAPADGLELTVTPGYDGDATAESDDVGSIATPVTVPGGQATLAITIPTVSDDVDEDDETFTVVIAATTGWVKTDDGGDTAEVTIVDNDSAGITVTAARPLAVSEGGSATYTVVLNSRPTADVTVTASSGDNGAATVHPASHVFSPSQWNQAKTFTVRGVSDEDTNDERVGIGHRVTSADAKYAGALASSVRVVVSDTTSAGEQGSGDGGQSTPTPTPTPETIDPATYSVSPFAVAIEGRSAALTITLSEAAPADGVAFTVTPGYDGDATAESDDVGSIATPVTVPGGQATLAITIPTVSDDVDEDVETFTVVIAAATTSWVKTGDGGDTAEVAIVDNDSAGITVTAAQPLAVSEGGSATYTVVLKSRPTADVTITAVSDDIGAATVHPASHVFSPSQWNQAKTFTVRGVSDDDTNDERVGIGHRVTSADAKYAGALVTSVRVAVSDPSTYSVSPSATVIEGGSAALTITLSEAAPADGVAFTVTPGYDGAATAEADDVGSIATPVTVPGGHATLDITIPTVSDDVDEGVETFTVVIATAATGWVKTGDGGDTAVVTIVDNDTAGITVSAARLEVSEGGSATYTVVLNSRPTADVTITAASDDVGAATVHPASHVFSPSQWNQAKTFTVRGVADDDTNDESVVIGHRVTSADGKYAGALVTSVRVVVSDTTPTPTPTPTPEPNPSGSGGSCPSDYEHEHGTSGGHWHSWSINQANGRCEHYVGHNGIGYHEH